MLKETINQIGPLDDNAMEEARKHHERLAMPLEVWAVCMNSPSGWQALPESGDLT